MSLEGFTQVCMELVALKSAQEVHTKENRNFEGTSPLGLPIRMWRPLDLGKLADMFVAGLS